MRDKFVTLMTLMIFNVCLIYSIVKLVEGESKKSNDISIEIRIEGVLPTFSDNQNEIKEDNIQDEEILEIIRIKQVEKD